MSLIAELRADPSRRDILIPQVSVESETYVNDRSVSTTIEVIWLFRSVRFEFNRPLRSRP